MSLNMSSYVYINYVNLYFDTFPIDLIATKFSHICLIDVLPQRSDPSVIIIWPRRTFKVQVPIGQAISVNGDTLRVSAFDEYGREGGGHVPAR